MVSSIIWWFNNVYTNTDFAFEVQTHIIQLDVTVKGIAEKEKS